MAYLDKRLSEIDSRWDELYPRVHDQALFEGLERELAVRWYPYFFTVPKDAKKRPALRTHVLALYDPFAKRSYFPAGIRFSCNVYVGCALQCAYCYIQTYHDDPLIRPLPKSNFRKRLEDDLDELNSLDLPPQPLHFSNSTDALQPHLESQHKDTLYWLGRLAEGEERHFRLIRMLTRNPERLLMPDYLALVKHLSHKLTIQVSIPMTDSKACTFYEPNVPSPQNRLDAIEKLCENGIPVMLRIDPLFPRDPLPAEWFGGKSLSGSGIIQPQSEGDLRSLVRFAADSGCKSIIFSALKIPRNLSERNSRLLKGIIQLYNDCASNGYSRLSRNYLRLPDKYQNGELIRPLVEEAKQCGIKIEHCIHNLITAR